MIKFKIKFVLSKEVTVKDVRRLSNFIIYGYLLKMKKNGEITKQMLQLLLKSFGNTIFIVKDLKDFDERMIDLDYVDVEDVRITISERGVEEQFNSYVTLDLSILQLEMSKYVFRGKVMSPEEKEKVRKINAKILLEFGARNQNGQI